MRKEREIEINLIGIQIGAILRLARLKKKISQHELSLAVNSSPTMIGRIERFENVSSWDKIYLISEQLNVDLGDLFSLKSKDFLIQVIDESFKLEEKLTKEKFSYYETLKTNVTSNFNSLK